MTNRPWQEYAYEILDERDLLPAVRLGPVGRLEISSNAVEVYSIGGPPPGGNVSLYCDVFDERHGGKGDGTCVVDPERETVTVTTDDGIVTFIRLRLSNWEENVHPQIIPYSTPYFKSDDEVNDFFRQKKIYPQGW